MTVLVTGGAGYIGSHMTYALVDRGEQVVVIDNLSSGIRGLVADRATFVEGDIGDKDLMGELLGSHNVDSVIHFAASTVVPESVSDPLSYYDNNTASTLSLIQSCVAEGVRRFIFSSTAAVYGSPEFENVTEESPTNPINPYGRSKLMVEWMLEDTARAHDLRYVALRYFNVAGADPGGRTGQSTPHATHLIKRACQAALGRIPHLEIFGTDYPTDDGTGVRDYIHVSDLVTAHMLALDHLRDDGNVAVLNCGYGRGASVREIVRAIEQVTGRPLPVVERERRPGDPARVVADAGAIRARLGWVPRHDDVAEIVGSAYAWEARLIGI